MRVLILFLFFGFGLFTSCSSNDEIDQENTIDGTWNLKTVYGGLQGVNIDYNQGDVIWNFDLQTNTLIVENYIMTTGPENIHSGLQSGSYDIEITQTEEIQTLFIDGTKRGVLILLDDNLKIDDGLEADGFMTEFER